MVLGQATMQSGQLPSDKENNPEQDQHGEFAVAHNSLSASMASAISNEQPSTSRWSDPKVSWP